jgi:hypothetical protein
MNSRCPFGGAVAWDGVLAWFVLGGVGGESLGGFFFGLVLLLDECAQFYCSWRLLRARMDSFRVI